MILCFATNNVHKLSEVSQLIRKDFQLVSLRDIGCTEDIPEDHDTIHENSKAKAGFVYRKYGVSCFADDTGLEVAALGGEPGVYSARYAGPGKSDDDNISLLLRNLEGKPDRSARFRTVFTLIIEGRITQFEGIVNGHITEEKAGTNGFGYDPVFMPEGYHQTFGQMSAEEKNRISHRAIATRKLTNFLNRTSGA